MWVMGIACAHILMTKDHIKLLESDQIITDHCLQCMSLLSSQLRGTL